MARWARLLLPAGSLALAACADSSEVRALVPDLASIDVARGPAPSYRGTISVGTVTGGKSEVESFLRGHSLTERALRESLEQTLGKARLGRTANGRFRLDVTLQKLDQPVIAVDMVVTATLAYRLTEVASGTLVYEQILVTRGVAAYGEQPAAIDRLRLADWRAVRTNLLQLVKRLYELPGRP